VIASMTGFASVSREANGDRVTATIKSVNHRFLDVQFKVPQVLAPIESRLRAMVQSRLTRGRVELSLNVDRTSLPVREVVVDEGLLAQVAAAIEGARDKGLVTGSLTASDVLRIPQAIEVRAKTVQDIATVPPAVAELVEGVLDAALAALVTMRATEGRYLATDLDTKLATLGALVTELEGLARDGQAALTDRLRERLAGLPADLAGDPAALAQEVVRFAARSDVDEEIVRMRGHVEHWRALADSPEACGRKLDFLLQEMNREINTIGSKIEGARATETVITAKAELERLREQVQNVE
jgi:uncharacterized protein (TIGR00255 family)